jgi:hypothetical protein
MFRNKTYTQQPEDEDGEYEKKGTVDAFARDYVKLSKKSGSSQKDIHYYDLVEGLYKGILFPDLFSKVRFPAPFTAPTFLFQQKSILTVDLNANGNAWVQVSLGQFLDGAKYKDGLTPGTRNGTSLVPVTNVFVNTLNADGTCIHFNFQPAFPSQLTPL